VLDALRQKEEVSVSVIARADSARRASLIMGAQLVAAPAPAAAPEWFEGWDDGHARHFYFHQPTGKSQWVKPDAPFVPHKAEGDDDDDDDDNASVVSSAPEDEPTPDEPKPKAAERAPDDKVEMKVMPLLLAMAHNYEKYEASTFWYGVCLILIRLLQTSLLVLFPDRMTKAAVGTLVAVISLTIAQREKPWLRDSDDKVAEVASWVVFAWLFALLVYDSLVNLPPVVFGLPLVLSAGFLVAFTIRACYKDYKSLEKEIEQEIEDGTAAENGGGDGTGGDDLSGSRGGDEPVAIPEVQLEIEGGDLGDSVSTEEKKANDDDVQSPTYCCITCQLLL